MRPSSYPLLPSGVRDHLPEASARLRAVQAALRSEFERWGYRPIVTPLYEYLGVLERGLGTGRRRETFKFVEPATGEVVALRPDITPQVARLYATRYAGETARFCYEGRVVRFAREEGEAGGGREGAGAVEVFQAGVELLGAGGPAADAEAISLLAAALQAAGLSEFQIDLGQVQVTRGVLDAAELDGGSRDAVVRLVARKDRSGLEALVAELGLPPGTRRALVALTTLYGGPEVLDEAERVVEAPAARRALADLREVVRLLAAEGCAERITIDLGELRDFDYHDGTLFHAYVPGHGVPVAGGGRYDHLSERYGRKAPATGFAVDVEEVVTVLDRQQAELPGSALAVLVKGVGASAVARALRAAGCRAAAALGGEQESARRLGFAWVADVDGGQAEVRRLADGWTARVPVGEIARIVGEG